MIRGIWICDLWTMLLESDTLTPYWNPYRVTAPMKSRDGMSFTNYSLTYLLTYLLTQWCKVFLEKPVGLHLVKKFPAFHWTRRFITALTSVHHLSLSWASPNQSIHPHPTSCRSILILSTHLRLDLPSGLLPSGFPTKALYRQQPIRSEKYQCRVDGVNSPDDGHIVARNMWRSWNKYTKKLCAPSWLHLKQTIEGCTVNKT